MHRVLVLCLSLALMACQSTEEWPSLAYRPGEGRPLGCGGQPSAETPSSPVAEAPELAAPAPLDIAPLAAQARDICARLDLLDRQWDSAAQKAEQAVRAAQDAPAGSPAWGAAHIALSLLEKTGSDIAAQQRQADDLVRIISRAGLRDSDDMHSADNPQTDNVTHILKTAERAASAMARHNSLFADLNARLAAPE